MITCSWSDAYCASGDGDLYLGISQPLASNTKAKIKGLRYSIFNNIRYNCELYETVTAINPVVTYYNKRANIDGGLKVVVGSYVNACPNMDLAYKVFRPGLDFRLGSEDTIQTEVPFETDTLLECPGDTIDFDGVYEDDTLGMYTYNWNFGNSQTSTEQFPKTVYEEPGTYHVVLIVSDSLGQSDTLSQDLLMLPCDSNGYQSYKIKKEQLSDDFEVNVNPNPSSGNIEIICNEIIRKLQIYNQLGEIISKPNEINSYTYYYKFSENTPKGIYTLKIISSNKTKVVKIILN